MDLLEIIQSYSPLSKLSSSKIERLVSVNEYPKDTLLFEKGKFNTAEYFILSGVCKTFLHNEEGESVTLSFYCDGSVMSPHTIRIRQGKSIIHAETLTPCVIGELDAKEFEQLMVDDIGIRDFGNAVLRKELLLKVEKEIALASLTAKQRLLHFRNQFPALENRISHQDIASYLGITNISLSRLRRELSP